MNLVAPMTTHYRSDPSLGGGYSSQVNMSKDCAADLCCQNYYFLLPFSRLDEMTDSLSTSVGAMTNSF